MKHLVTGGAGFIGCNLANRLAAEGHDVTVVDNGSRGSNRWLLSPKIQFFPEDIREPLTSDSDIVSSLWYAAKYCDVVWHLAAVNGTASFYSKPYEVLEVQIRGTLNVIQRCIEQKIPTLVLFSSSEVYQTAPKIPTPEDVPLVVPDLRNPRFSYGGGKIAAELMAWHSPIPRVVIVRPHNVIGPNMGFDHVVPQMTMAMHRAPNRSDYTIKDAGHTRSFIHVDDFTDGVLTAWQKGTEKRDVFHIGTEEQITISALAGKIAKLVGKEFRWKTGEGARGGTRNRCPDTAKIRSLGWAPKKSLDEALGETVKAYLADEDRWPA